MKIEVKILPKEEFNEDNLSWSEGVPIDDFILNPHDVEFYWEEEGLTLPYNDFIFFGNEYYYDIFINGICMDEFEKKMNK